MTKLVKLAGYIKGCLKSRQVLILSS